MRCKNRKAGMDMLRRFIALFLVVQMAFSGSIALAEEYENMVMMDVEDMDAPFELEAAQDVLIQFESEATSEPTVSPTAAPSYVCGMEAHTHNEACKQDGKWICTIPEHVHGASCALQPTAEPTLAPTAEPTVEPTLAPTAEFTAEPTLAPTAEPTVEPTLAPTAEPTVEATMDPAATLAPPQMIVEGPIRLGYGEKRTLNVSFSDGEVRELSYSTSNKKYVSVSKNGVIKGNRANKSAYITISSSDGQSVKLKVSVKEAPKSVSLNRKKWALGVGESAALIPKLPKGTESALQFSSSAPEIVCVDENGNLRALAQGDAKITVRTYNGKIASCAVQVLAQPESVMLDADAITLGAGEKYALQAEVNSGSAGAIDFESADPNIAAVDPESGEITAIAAGSVCITARSYAGAPAMCAVTVKNAPEGISISTKKLKISLGDCYQLPEPELLGEDVYSKQISYKSSDSKVVSVNSSGLLKAKRTGTCTITIKTYNGKSTKLKISVVKAPGKISIQPKDVTLCMYEEIWPTVRLSNGAAGGYHLETSDATVAAIMEDGLGVRAVGAGSAQITAVSFNKKKAVLDVKVLDLPTEIALKPEKSALAKASRFS